MRIAACTSFLGYFVFLHPIELISSDRRDILSYLFIASEGIDLPQIQEVTPQYVLRYGDFLMHGDHAMSILPESFLRRGHVICGWKQGDKIQPLCLLYGESNLFIVFDTLKREWVILRRQEFERLGPYHSLTLIRARDAAHYAVAFGTDNLHSNGTLHYKASERAYYDANTQEEIQTALLKQGQATLASSAAAVEKAYREKYIEAYQLYSTERLQSQ